ncbi:MOSC domain-containing protein [Actinoplanes sp. URMC 104]|uniref:MOSC domain-containing protein n=1 Tax=Actinoplanes sp. URMC 104 TaxID=3423409 RepID=UPI003F1E1CA2
MTDGKVLSVNVGVARPNPAKRHGGPTGIDKLPVEHAVEVRAPGPKRTGLHSGVVGDPIGDTKHHGGDDQAVYAYSREDYDWWEAELGRSLPDGYFGENMTTVGLDVNATQIGEVWRIGDVLELQPTFGRIPCATFQAKMGEKGWLKRFARVARTGTYLRVITPGPLRAGDPIDIVHRPARSIGVSEAFDIYMHRSEELARLLDAEALPSDLREEIERRL